VTAAAEVWLKDQIAIGRLIAALPEGRAMLVRYEDLCTNPQGTLARLWQFCGVQPFDPPASLRSSDHHILGNSMRLAGAITVRLDESWRERLDREEQHRVLRIGGTMNRELGYA
jgi:hypothetical protein